MKHIQFPYHSKLTDYFRKQKKTWEWFSQNDTAQKELEEFKNKILKSTYRLSRDSEAKVYELVDIAKEKLQIKAEIVMFQELHSTDINAMVIPFDDQINIIFSGNILTNLSERELLVVIAHELSHILFYKLENGDFETTNKIINAIVNDGNSDDVMIETTRLYQLYTELYCDRGSLVVVNDLDTVVETLVKLSTGLQSVSAKNYLKQAREIFAEEHEGSKQLSHPEMFIRSRALEIFVNKEDEALIDKMIDAQWGMNRLDVFKQEKLYHLTKKMLQVIEDLWFLRQFII